jgi:uncharacterized repeat protein (TIGR01451 family)
VRKIQSLILAIGVTAGGYGHAIDYEAPELLMRSGPGSAYQIPVGSSWSSKTPSVNNDGQVAMSINAVPPDFHAGVWLGSSEGGGIVDIASGSGWLYSDVNINDDGQIVWVRNESSQDGIVMYDPVEDETVYLTGGPLGASSWTAVAINNQGVVGYRPGFGGGGGNAWVSWDDDGHVVHLAESESDYAFLFTPSLNNQRQIAGKAAIDSFSTNQIIIANADGSVDVLVEDNELDPDSPFSNFNNSIGFNDQGQVAFIGQLAAGGSGVFIADASGWTQLAVVGEDGLDSIEAFSPVLNEEGVVAFRGFNDNGNRAIWVADGHEVVAIATEGDIVDTDIGPARLQSPDSVGGPNFGGSPTINDAGQVGFVSLLTDPESSSVSRGRGLFLASPEIVDEPAMSLEKTATPEIYDEVGEVIEYSYTVENTGNLTLTGPITVDDDQEAVSCPGDDLEPGTSLVCTAEREISQQDLDAGSVTNLAVASNAQTSSNEASFTITAEQQATLEIGKVLSQSPDPIEAGSELTYTVTATNAGNITLTDVEVTDSLIEPASITCDTLAPGEHCELVGSYVVDQDDVDSGEIVNVAHAQAPGAEGVETSLNTPIEQQPGLVLDKTADPMIYSEVGEVIAYSYVVSNTGNVTLAGPVTVNDDQETVDCPAGDLTPGSSLTCHAERIISEGDMAAGSVTNTATAHADGIDSDEVVVTVRTPPIFDDRFEASED